MTQPIFKCPVLAFAFLLFFAFESLVEVESLAVNPLAMSAKKYDVIVWGATGYTGKVVAEYITTRYGASPSEFKWAIGGRSKDKLEQVKQSLSEIDEGAKSLDTVIADGQDLSALKEQVAGQARAVVSTVGPYAQWGTSLVQACVEEKTHYCDLTAEVFWMQDCMEKWDEEAKANKVKIINCSGFDSVPSDLGVLVLADHAKTRYGADLASVDNYLMDAKGGFSGGTAASGMGIAEDSWKMGVFKAMKRFGPYCLNPKGEEVPGWDKGDGTFGYSKDIGRWAAPFVMAPINARVVRRSNALLTQEGKGYGAPFKYSERLSLKFGGVAGMLVALIITVLDGITPLLAVFPPTRYLLKMALPAQGTGPSKEARDTGFFEFKMVAKTKPLAGEAEGETIVAEVSSHEGDGGYKETAKMLAEAGITLALEEQVRQNMRSPDSSVKTQERFGFLTPATGCGMPLVNRLRQSKMKFEIK